MIPTIISIIIYVINVTQNINKEVIVNTEDLLMKIALNVEDVLNVLNIRYV